MMLLTLCIENFALIERLELELAEGFTVFTGETGAGKSIIMDALALLTGARGATEFIRHGAQETRVSGVFLPADREGWVVKLQQQGIEPEEDGTIFLERVLNLNGRSQCRINGRLLPLNQYRELIGGLAEIHAQHQQQFLLRPERHLELLDRYAGRDHCQQVRQLAQLARRYRQLLATKEELQASGRQRWREIDLLRYQLQEIDKAQLQPGEEEELLERVQLLGQAERLAQSCGRAYELLAAGSGRQPAALDLLAQVMEEVKQLARLHQGATPLATEVEECYYRLEELARELSRYQEKIEFDPEGLELAQERLDLIKQLCKKYGSTVTDVLAYREQIKLELNKLEQAEENLEEIQLQLEQLEQEGKELAEVVNGQRRQAAILLARAIENQLADLAMAGSRFSVQLSPTEHWSQNGGSDAEFFLSPNPGEPLKPLAKIASGGELSRILLALRTVLLTEEPGITLVFDEVDAGLSGAAARKVGEKLAQLGQQYQVLSITHSPAVAGLADQHFYIYKEVVGERTFTRVKTLAAEERLTELARMVGGEHTGELLKAQG
ncbi:DNA replication and repair protein RecN [Carboxydocella thermautotrophica]|nr:DNA replication and repair protein RecN [Carboxydocella thermautotrophica]